MNREVGRTDQPANSSSSSQPARSGDSSRTDAVAQARSRNHDFRRALLSADSAIDRRGNVDPEFFLWRTALETYRSSASKSLRGLPRRVQRDQRETRAATSARWRTASSNLCKSNSGRASIRDRRDRVNDLLEPTRLRYWKLDVRLAYQFLPGDRGCDGNELERPSRTTIP